MKEEKDVAEPKREKEDKKEDREDVAKESSIRTSICALQDGIIYDEKKVGKNGEGGELGRELGIEIPVLSRVEGHSRIVVRMKGKEVVDARLEIFEGMRLFEAWMRGRSYIELHHFASRVCGMCSASHQLASIHAIEDGLGIVPSEQTIRLRELICYGEMLQETALHMYVLSLPDYLGYNSIIDMAAREPEEVKDALKVKSVGNDICRVIVGRAVHQWSMHPGGFSKIPDKRTVSELLVKIREILPCAWRMVERFSKLEYPEYRRTSQYLALCEDKYAFENGKVNTTNKSFEIREFEKNITEEVVPYSTSKRSRIEWKSYQVGPLARMNLSYNKLGDMGKKALGMLNVKFPSDNPFHSNAARAVELMEIIDRIIGILEKNTFKIEEIRNIPKEYMHEEGNLTLPKSGDGYGATEAPRGTLFYHFKFDNKGKAEYVNIITPTAQNQLRIEEDMRGYLETISDMPKEEIAHKLQMLVRSYDPCNSCAAHVLIL
ncbi:MAG: nickel-dependent hydrogenase large subunit [Thermoplasmata archaeon]